MFQSFLARSGTSGPDDRAAYGEGRLVSQLNGLAGRTGAGGLNSRQSDLNDMQIVAVRQVVVRIEAQIGDDVRRDPQIGVVVVVDGSRAWQGRGAGLAVGVQPVPHQADDFARVVGMSLDIHAGDVRQGLIVAVRFGVENQALAAPLQQRTGQAQAEIGPNSKGMLNRGRRDLRSSSTREMSWIDRSHAVIILTISVKRTTPLSL